MHGGTESRAVLRVAQLHREWADDEVCLARLALLELLGDWLVVLVDDIRREGKDEHRIGIVVLVRQHHTVLVRREVRVVTADRTPADGRTACGPGIRRR